MLRNHTSYETTTFLPSTKARTSNLVRCTQKGANQPTAKIIKTATEAQLPRRAIYHTILRFRASGHRYDQTHAHTDTLGKGSFRERGQGQAHARLRGTSYTRRERIRVRKCNVATRARDARSRLYI